MEKNQDPPKRAFHKYSEEALDKALKKIREENWAIRKASKEFGVPRSTIQDRIHGRIVEKPRQMGPDTVLSAAEEQTLVEWLLNLAKCGFPQKPSDLLNTVQKIILEENRKTPFKDGLPGKTWYYGFLKRHPELSLRTPEGLSKGRAIVTEESIRKWFSDLKNYLHEIGAADVLEDPTRIFNGDETSFSLSPKSGIVLAPKRWKNLYKVSQSNEKETITVLFLFSANGETLPPLVVFPYVRPPQALIRSMPDKWILGRSESGWMRSETFFEYVANSFNNWLTENDIKRPILFLVDGHKSHLTMELSDFCRNNDIILYSLLPNTTHITQPADVGAFKGIKQEYKNTVHKWHSIPGNAGKAVTKTNFCEVLKMVLDSSDRTEIVKKSFRKCGIFPFNPDAIDFTKCVRNELEAQIEKENISVTQNSFMETKKVLSLAKDELLKNNIDYDTVCKIIDELQHTNFVQHGPNDTQLSASFIPTVSDQSQLDNTLTGTYLVSSSGELQKVSSNVSGFIEEENAKEKEDSILALLKQADELLTSIDQPPTLSGTSSYNPPSTSSYNPPGTSCYNPPETSSYESPQTSFFEPLGSSSIDKPLTVAQVSRRSSTSVSTITELLTNVANEKQTQRTPSATAVSSAFGKHLFYPELTPKSTKPTRAKAPASISSLAWKNFFGQKNDEKARKVKEQELRKQNREKKRLEGKKNKTKKLKKKVIPCSQCEEELISDIEDDNLKNVGCDSCPNWFHLKCTRFAGSKFEEIKDEIFICKECDP